MPKLPIEQDRPRSSRALSLSRSWTLWESWVVVMALAQVVGLGIVAIAGTFINSLGTIGTVTVLHLVGLLQGIVLGVAQWLVLRRYIRHSGQWIAVTAIAAMIAWLIGIKASAVMVLVTSLDTTLTAEMKTATLLKDVFLLGAWVGGVLGIAQWFVLKHRIRQALWWVLANALAWAVGLGVAFMGAGMMRTGDFSNLKTALAGAATGLSMGAVVGAITGIALVWLLKPRRLGRN